MELKKEEEAKQYLVSQHYNTWQLIKLYWQSNHRASAYFFTIIILLMTTALVVVDVVFNFWYNYFYNALQAYNVHDTVRLLVVFCILAAVAIILAVYRYYVSQLFGLRWRRWLTYQFINRWLAKRGYYYLENFDKSTDNPDQRIQEDVNALVLNAIDLTTSLVTAIITFFAFVYILWSLSGILNIPLGSYGTFHLHGYLLWVGLIYAIIGTQFTFRIGRPLVGLNFEQQRREATFRYAAIDLRTHAEHVALYRGEDHQKSIFTRLFGSVLENWYAIILRQKLLLWYTSGYTQITVLLPLIVALPNYFDKVFLLGGLIQSLQAFGKVQDSLSFIVNSYTQIAQWQAISYRLTSFANHLTDVDQAAQQADHLTIQHHAQKSIDIKNLTITTPRNETLLKNVNLSLQQGNNYLIKGESGIGKSTFVRTLGGIWPFASGEISYPNNERAMYLPQKPYMPIGTLEEAIIFPDKDGINAEKHARIESVLRDCNLASFIPRLKESATWSDQLSPGEQQRIAFARVLLQKPDWVFLDESTSSLDLANEEYLYKLLREKLPQCSIVSVGHRGSLDVLHDEIIDIKNFRPEAVV